MSETNQPTIKEIIKEEYIKCIGIYRITSPSNKVYIGQSINIDKRFQQHRGSFKKRGKLKHSLEKYGPENHIFEIIEECLLEELDERETFHKIQFIEEFGWENALFCELYDKGGGPRSQETKDKISKSNQNHQKWYTQEVRDKMSIPKPKGFGEKISKVRMGKPSLIKGYEMPFKGRISPNKGRKYSLKPEVNMWRWKPVLQFDKQGNFIKEWPSITIAANETNSHSIPKCLAGKYPFSGGFIWKYK